MKKIFKNIKYEKYYKYILPYFKNEKNQKYFTVILTLGASIFFTLFAINPTISTIVKLRKEISDSRFVEEQLSEKISNLSNLSTAYQNLEEDLPYIYDAIPENPEAPTLVGQIQGIANDSEVAISKLNISPINLIVKDASTSSSLGFELTGEGNYENLQRFTSDLINMQRIVSVDSISIEKDTGEDGGLETNIKGSSYFRK